MPPAEGVARGSRLPVRNNVGHSTFGTESVDTNSVLAHLTGSLARPPNLPHAATCDPVAFSLVRQDLPQPLWVPDHRLSS